VDGFEISEFEISKEPAAAGLAGNGRGDYVIIDGTVGCGKKTPISFGLIRFLPGHPGVVA